MKIKIYVASSWRNPHQQAVVKHLRIEGFDVYDFRNPADGDIGFHWSEIDPDWQSWKPGEYIKGLEHPLAVEGFKNDYDAMQWADACVMVMPCGRSAHLEAGWFVGNGKPVIALLQEDYEPELMLKMCSALTTEVNKLTELLNAIVLLNEGCKTTK